MSFSNIYQEKKEVFEAQLKSILGNLKNVPELLLKAMEYSLITSGGKRIRPIMFLEMYRCFKGEPTDSIYKFAAAIECVHTYSLIHDDLPCMDNDDFRRGRPTNHKMFGEGVAVLAGDALLNLAYEFIFELAQEASDEEKALFLKAGAYFSKSMGCRGLIAGQVVDIKVSDSVTGDMLKYIFRHKTGDLIIGACVTGSILGEATREEIETVIQFADYFSYAFQIRDDLLDHKEKGKDDSGTSFVKVYGKTRATQTLGDSTQKAQNALDSLEKSGKNIEFFKKMTIKFATRKD